MNWLLVFLGAFGLHLLFDAAIFVIGFYGGRRTA